MNNILDDLKMAFRSGNVLNQLIVINLVAFVVVNIGLFVLLTLSGQREIYDQIMYYLSLPSDPAQFITQPWTIFTYMFLHRGFFHILFNMLIMYWFGRIITEYLGQNKVLGLYVLGGLAGGLLYMLAYNVIPYYEGSRAILAGASAGVLAIVVGAATFQPNFTVNLILLGPVRLKYIAIFAILSSIMGTVGYNAGGEIAHLGGAGLGYLFITQLQRGSDWSKPVAAFVTWGKSFFVSQPKVRVSYKNEEKFGSRKSGRSKTKTRSRAKSRQAAASSTTSQDEIDAILDKISEKGYDALSKEEKQKLFNASKD